MSAIKKALENKGAVVVKFHGSAFTEKGTPDLIGCYHGQSFVMEVKQPGEEATPIQLYKLSRWKKAGAVGGVVSSVEEALVLLQECDHE